MSIFILWFKMIARLHVHYLPAGNRGSTGEQRVSGNWTWLFSSFYHKPQPTRCDSTTSFLPISAECTGFILRRALTKSINAWVISFANNTCMRYWAIKNGKKNCSNKAKVLAYSRCGHIPHIKEIVCASPVALAQYEHPKVESWSAHSLWLTTVK